jgi:3-hydroxyisobutyrate dehydrogenase-like beta-hydroxyacid dehydrogenase
MPDRAPIGVVGLGLMGGVFSRRLIDARFDVLGFDIDREKGEALNKMGGRTAASMAELALASRPIVLAVFNTDQVEEVVEKALLPALGDNSGKIVMCTSTCDPDRVEALAARVARRGLRFLEAPVSGTSDQVRRGDGVGLLGGDEAIAADITPVLDVLFPKRFHVGAVGDGGRAKLAVNLILNLNRLALAEGLVFASRVGLDPDAFMRVARGSAAYSQVMDTKGPKMVHSDFVPEGRVRQALKDVHLMLEQARRKGQQLPALEADAAVLEACVRHGEGDLDNSVIIEEIRRRRLDP